MAYYRAHSICGEGVCLTLMESWFSGPGEEREVYLKGFENVTERHMKRSISFKLFLGLYLMVCSQEEDGKCGERERGRTCIKGPRGRCGYMVCVLHPEP